MFVSKIFQKGIKRTIETLIEIGTFGLSQKSFLKVTIQGRVKSN